MNTLYPDATTQDLQAIENVCIICREDMTAAGNYYKIICLIYVHLNSEWHSYNLYLIQTF